MAFDHDDIRDRLRRYRELHRSNSDPKSRQVLEELIRELEQQLGEGREPD